MLREFLKSGIYPGGINAKVTPVRACLGAGWWRGRWQGLPDGWWGSHTCCHHRPPFRSTSTLCCWPPCSLVSPRWQQWGAQEGRRPSASFGWQES